MKACALENNLKSIIYEREKRHIVCINCVTYAYYNCSICHVFLSNSQIFSCRMYVFVCLFFLTLKDFLNNKLLTNFNKMSASQQAVNDFYVVNFEFKINCYQTALLRTKCCSSFLVFCVVLLCVFTFSVPCCDVLYDVRHKNNVWFVLISSCLQESSCLMYNTHCVVFLVCFSPSCCQFLWIFHF